MLSAELHGALCEAVRKVPIFPGQYVQVKAPSDEDVIEGWVHEVYPDMAIVRIRSHSGTDHVIDVDMTKYEIWVQGDPNVHLDWVPWGLAINPTPRGAGAYTGMRGAFSRG